MIWFEMGGPPLAPMSGQNTQEAADFAKKLVEDCKQYGAHLGYQNYAFTPKSANEMTVEEIHAFQDSVVNVCKTVQGYGFEAFEINAAGFQHRGVVPFARPERARGRIRPADLENRARYVVELVQKIKAACGEGFAVQVLHELHRGRRRQHRQRRQGDLARGGHRVREAVRGPRAPIRCTCAWGP